MRRLATGVCAIGTTLILCLLLRTSLAAEARNAPGCALVSLDGTQAMDLQQFRGKVLYVDFWASWCGPCAKAFPHMNDLDRDLGQRGLKVVAINLDEHPSDAASFLARSAARFTVLMNPDKECPRAFGVQGMPTSYLIDRQGVIRYQHLGFRPGDAGGLRARVEKLLDEDAGAN